MKRVWMYSGTTCSSGHHQVTKSVEMHKFCSRQTTVNAITKGHMNYVMDWGFKALPFYNMSTEGIRPENL